MTTVDDYLAAASADYHAALTRLRETVRNNLPPGFQEVMTGTMPGYVVPLETYPAGYHVGKGTPLPFINFASQKNHIALYHFAMYVDAELMSWFKNAWTQHTTAKLDMGKSCIRFRKPGSIPFELIADLMQQRSVEEWVDCYEAVRSKTR